MALIEKKDKQTILDVVLENTGAISSLFDFIEANNLSSLEIPTGKYIATPELNPSVVSFFKSINAKSNIFPITTNTPPFIPTGGDIHLFNSDLSIDEVISAPADRELLDVTITIKNSANETITTESLAAAVDGTVTAPDGTVVLKRINGTVIDSPTVKSGSTIDKTITNSTVIVRNSANTIIGNYSVNAQTTLHTVMADKTFTVRRSDATIINTIPIVTGVDGGFYVNDSIVSIKNTLGALLTTQSVRAAASIDKVLSNISFTDSDGTVSSIPAGVNVTATPQIKTALIKGLFAIGRDTMETLIIDSDNAGTYTSITDDGASGTITLSKNGGAFGAFSNPLVLVTSDTLVVKRTVTTSIGYFKLIGSYV